LVASRLVLTSSAASIAGTRAGFWIVLDHVSPVQLSAYIAQQAHGRCDSCGNETAIDLRASHRVYSLLVYTSWWTVVKLECRACSRKRQIGDLFFCVFLGWWGVPSGLIVTPMQLIRNAMSLSDGEVPSRRFKQIIKIDLARRLVASGHEENRAGT
jgi:hypothetical protein